MQEIEKKIKIRKQYYNEETGEVYVDEIVGFESVKIKKKELTVLINKDNVSKEDKEIALKGYLYSKKQLNSSFKRENQFLLKDCFSYSKNIEKAVIEELQKLSIYIVRLFLSADDFNYCIKFNRQTACKNWEDIYKAIHLTNKDNQQKFKKFCIKYDILRKIIKDKKDINNNLIQDVFFYFNPNYRKNSIYVVDHVLWLYMDIIEKNKTVDEFVIDLLKLKFE